MQRTDWNQSTQSRLDWLRVETPEVTACAVAHEADWFEVSLSKLDDNLSAEKALDALQAALSFALGRPVALRGYEEHSGNECRRVLISSAPPPARRLLAPPFSVSVDYNECIEQLLQAAIPFFLTELGQEVAAQLELLWYSSDNPLPTQMLLTGICCEGLIRLATAGTSSTSAPTLEEKGLLARWLSENSPPAGTSLSTRFAQRVTGAVNSWNEVRPADTLQEWRSRSHLGVTKEDIQAWRDLRHPAAHGRIATFEEITAMQAGIDRLTRTLNLMNRITLSLMGYSHLYRDYSQPDWPLVPFPWGGNGHQPSAPSSVVEASPTAT